MPETGTPQPGTGHCPALPCNPALKTLPELCGEVERLKAAGRCIVFTNGCYDLLHPGHVDLLTRARALGDVLILGLNSDDSVRRLGKAPDRPVNPFAVRAFVLGHLASINYLVGFDEDTPLELVRAIRPHVLVKGGDWPVDRIVGSDIVLADGGKVLSLPLLPGFSTTAMLARIRTQG
jgi:cytidyltransferase-related domain